MKCKFCGKENIENAKFCEVCGKPIGLENKDDFNQNLENDRKIDKLEYIAKDQDSLGEKKHICKRWF